MTTLIDADDTWLLWAVILACVAASIFLEQTYRWAAKLSGPVLALCIAMLLANLRIMPPKSDVYETVQNRLVPLALPLLLFRANLFQIVRTTGWLFLAFHLASIGTVCGAFAAAALLRPYVDNPAEIAAVMTASYIGGAVNFLAVTRSYNIDENITGPLLVADNFIMAATFMVLLLTCQSRWARRWYRHPHTAAAVDARQLAAEHWRPKEIALLDIAAAMSVAAGVLAAAYATSQLVQTALQGGEKQNALAEVLGNFYVHITLWSTLLATAIPGTLAKIRGADEIGGYLLYVFLFVIGLPADLWLVLTQVPMMFVFCLIIAAANLLVAFVAGKLLNLELEHLVLAVNASLGGPPTAAAMAISLGWSTLVLPALLIGIWGYTIGTAVGLLVGEALRSWL